MTPLIPWWAQAVIYEISVRHFSEEGNLQGVIDQLERLQKLGVTVIWLMPIYPIGVTKRKGNLGSPYSISDYRAVHEDLGNFSDVVSLVNKAHDLGMKVILDWVANHTAWDHAWIEDHPDWYLQIDGEISEPVNPDGSLTGWADVAKLNYDREALRKAMIADMAYWIQQANIDGFRCDMAGLVPLDFWIEAREELSSIKEIFMLAEWEDPNMHKAFDATYTWELHHILNDVASGRKPAWEIAHYYDRECEKFDVTSDRLLFTTNHDENAWSGTVYKRMGENEIPMAVLVHTLFGMPLIFNGQETNSRKVLPLFENEDIDWEGGRRSKLYASLNHLRKTNQALWSGEYGGPVEWIRADEEGLIYKREMGLDGVLVALNFSASEQSYSMDGSFEGVNMISKEKVIVCEIVLKAHEFLVFYFRK